MKILTVVLAMTLSATTNAQKIEPSYIKVGDMIKGTYYHDNGKIAQIGCFKDGRLQGKWIMYADTGKKIGSGAFNKGKRTGQWFFWKHDGEALREVTYLNGRLLSVVEWKNSAPTL